MNKIIFIISIINLTKGENMMVLGKVDKEQLVRSRPTQSIASSVEPNPTHRKVTDYVKLGGGMYWVVTQVKEVSSEIYDLVEVAMVHNMESRMCNCAKASNYRSTGVAGHDTIQDGIYLNLGGPLCSYESEYFETSRRKQGSRDGTMEVGLIHSTRSMGKPGTRGRDQQCSDSLSTFNSLKHGG